MRPHHWLRILRGAALVVVVVVVCHAQQNKNNSTEAKNGKNTSPNVTVVVKQENPPHVEEGEKQNEEESKIQNKLTNFTGLLVVVGLVQAFVLGLTAWLIKRQADQMVEAGKQTERIIAQMKDTTVRQLRAYVGPSAATIKCAGVGKYFAAVEIKNFGQTPAYKMRNFTDSYIGPYKSEETQFKEPSGSGIYTTGTLFPNSPFYGSKDVETSNPDTGHIFIYGKIEYEDVFKQKRWTRYRFVFPTPNTVLRPTIGELYPLTITQEGNDTEET